MKYYNKEIYDILPHRYPMMFLDSIEIVDNKAVAEVMLSNKMWFFSCHYPEKAIMPLSLLIEAMSQTFTATLLCQLENKEIPLFVELGRGEALSLKESATIGDKLRLEAILKTFRRGIAKGECAAYKNDCSMPILEFSIVEVVQSQMVKMS